MEKSVNIFRFKQFSIVNERSAMKVNTDGVLLGALMTILPEDRNFLDIGTGTGTIALMAAQRLMHNNERKHIDAIDIDDETTIDLGTDRTVDDTTLGVALLNHLPADLVIGALLGKDEHSRAVVL